MIQTNPAAEASETAGHMIPLRFHIVFNNVPYREDLQTAWGFACLIEGLDKTVLFDTGSDGDILLSNLRRLGLDAKPIQVVVLSHDHWDHTGGLSALLARHPGVTVYVPESFPASFQQEVKRLGAATETVSRPRPLLDRVFSTGAMGGEIVEQALMVDTREGLVVITGCAHPNVADMVERARDYLGKDIYLLMGGFHLRATPDAEIRAIIRRLQALGVKKVAPSHCTGDNAIRLFRDAWADDFLEGGLGAVIEASR